MAAALEVGDQPWGTKDEVLHYVDLMPTGRCASTPRYRNANRHHLALEDRSCSTRASTTSPGAWSGRGKIRRVDVSFDGGRNWRTARLENPLLAKCLTRFNIDWVWDGGPAILQSRAIDETGYVQPKINQLREVRGKRSIYHNNAIQSWKVAESGEVSNVQVY